MKNKMKSYQERKAEIREKAIDWQYKSSQKSMYWSEVAYWSNYWYKQAKRYGLVKEFRENAII